MTVKKKTRINPTEKKHTMEKAPFILLILNCQKYRTKALFQKRTWLTQLPANILYFHVIGDPDMDIPFCFFPEENRLMVRVQDDYVSLPKKVLAALRAVSQTYCFEYIFKTDDDQMVVNISFFSVLTRLLSSAVHSVEKKVHYGGNIVDVMHSYVSQYSRIHPELPANLPIQKTKYCSGRFYFLSREAVAFLVTDRVSALVAREYLEDYAIGFYLAPIFKVNIMHLGVGKHFVDVPPEEYDKMMRK